jgi:hypothetical protein
MEIREAESMLEVLHVGTEPREWPTAGDLMLSVRVSSAGFAGFSPNVWVDARSFKTFVEQLRELEARRQGTARLESMSPNEFWLEIRSIDRAGHMAALGRLQRWQFRSGDGGYYQAVEFEFEFCPSWLPRMVAEFRSMRASHVEALAATERGQT